MVAAAVQQFHGNGYTRTSIADIAKTAGVSAGNVFYFFKAREDLARAAVDDWCRLLTEYLNALDRLPGWRKVSKIYRPSPRYQRMHAALGCPLAGITRDLRLEGDVLQADAGRIYNVQFSWLESQSTEGGFSQEQATAMPAF